MVWLVAGTFYGHTSMVLTNILSRPAAGCWLLKAPLHSLYLETLLRTYPDARVIVTQRGGQTHSTAIQHAYRYCILAI